MDLIGSIRYIGNRLSERKPGSGKNRPAKKREQAKSDKTPSDGRLGQRIDTSA